MNRVVTKVQNQFKVGINSNTLKIIAIVLMIVDHAGYYMCFSLNNTIYLILRAFGRLAMPIFVYLLVQGFFHTRDVKKYNIKIFTLAIITQIITCCIGFLNLKLKTGYYVSINEYLNILFSFSLTLILLSSIHEKKIVKKWNSNQNMFLKIFIILTIIGIYIFMPIDYGMRVPFIAVCLYYLEKLKISIYMNRNNVMFSAKSFASNLIKDSTLKTGYIVFILVILIISIRFATGPIWLAWISILSILPIALYNGDRGKKNKKIGIAFYSVFPLQHAILYLIASLMCYIK